MFDIKEHMTRIRSEVGEEMASKIAGHLNSIEMAYTDLSKARGSIDEARVKYRDRADELTKEVEELQRKIVGLNNDDSVKELTEKVKKLEGFQTQVYKENREKFTKMFDNIKEHANFDKVKSNFKLGELKDDAYDNTSLSDEDVNHNINKLTEYQSLGIFGDGIDIKNIPPGKPPGGEPPGKDIDIVKLAKEDPAAAAKHLSDQGIKDDRINRAFLKK